MAKISRSGRMSITEVKISEKSRAVEDSGRGAREEVGQRKPFLAAAEVGRDDRQRRGEFGQDLAAGPARADDLVGVRHHGKEEKIRVSGGHGSPDRHALCAHGEAEAQVFHIAPAEDRSVRASDRRPDEEPGIRGMGVKPRGDGAVDQGL